MVVVGGDRLLRLVDVMEKTTLGKTKLRNMMKDGRFPASRKVGNATVWRESDVDHWIAEVMDTSGVL